MTASIKMWLIGLCFLMLGTASAFADDVPDLKLVEESFDFGCVGVDFKVYHDFKMVNQGPETIFVDTVTAHCDCTVVRFQDSVVAPGDTASFRIIFNTANFYGPMEKDVRIHSSDSKAPTQHVYYSANIGQWLLSIQPDPVSVFFLPGKNTRISRLVNYALDEISLANIEPLDDVFRIRPVKDEASKGEAIELELTPNPDLAPSTYKSNFTVTLNLPDNLPPLRITIPVTVAKY